MNISFYIPPIYILMTTNDVVPVGMGDMLSACINLCLQTQIWRTAFRLNMDTMMHSH